MEASLVVTKFIARFTTVSIATFTTVSIAPEQLLFSYYNFISDSAIFTKLSSIVLNIIVHITVEFYNSRMFLRGFPLTLIL